MMVGPQQHYTPHIHQLKLQTSSNHQPVIKKANRIEKISPQHFKINLWQRMILALQFLWEGSRLSSKVKYIYLNVFFNFCSWLVFGEKIESQWGSDSIRKTFRMVCIRVAGTWEAKGTQQPKETNPNCLFFNKRAADGTLE